MKNLSNYLQEIETAVMVELEAVKPLTEPILYQAMKYAISGGGKRVRPILMLLSADTLAMPHTKIIGLAVALECIHTYSLIHDDLPSMDDDDFRRGRLSVHKMYGEAVAVLAGDALLNLAYEIILNACQNDSTLTGAALALAQAAGATGMVGGQAADVTKTINTKTDCIAMYAGKTGALIRSAIIAPYIAANSSNLPMIKELAEHIGLVFQLADDLLDFIAGGDKDKTTYVSLFGQQETIDETNKLNDRCNELYALLKLEYSSLREYTDALSHRLK